MYGRESRYQNNEEVFSSLVRVGRVTAVNNDKRIAQVQFEDMGLPSGWLPVLITRDFIPGYDGPQQTELEGGGSGDAAFENHKHALTIKPYMPKVNDQVLVLYEPIRDGRGFILGGIQPWR